MKPTTTTAPTSRPAEAGNSSAKSTEFERRLAELKALKDALSAVKPYVDPNLLPEEQRKLKKSYEMVNASRLKGKQEIENSITRYTKYKDICQSPLWDEKLTEIDNLQIQLLSKP